MISIGITGGIGSGKSVAARIFSVLGIPVFNADAVAKTIMETDIALKAAIQKEFGSDAYIDEKLNRPFIANIVFNNAFKLEKLNALVHPATIKAANEWMAVQKAPYIIKEAALFFEAGTAGSLNYIIGVTAPQALRLKRVMDRDKLSREDVLARMKRQMSETLKMKLCDFVITNNEQELIIPQVLKLHERFLEIAALKK